MHKRQQKELKMKWPLCWGGLAYAEFQKIVNRTITPQLLKWKGVEATQEIAKSSNAKVIVIGNGDGDLPIILGGQ